MTPSDDSVRRHAGVKLCGSKPMETMLHDLRYALRVLRKNAGFTFVTVFTLALGIGATTAIFGVVYGVLLRPLPYDKPNQIVHLWELKDRGHRMNFTHSNFEDIM